MYILHVLAKLTSVPSKFNFKSPRPYIIQKKKKKQTKQKHDLWMTYNLHEGHYQPCIP